MRPLIPLYAIASLLIGFTIAKTNNGLTVTTQQGDVAGSLVVPTVRRFLGIPYAKAGRWQPPTSPPVRTNTFNATEFGDACYQSRNRIGLLFLEYMGFSDGDEETEDCLTLNIWAPSVGRKQSTAVLIWIYGGAFQIGSGSDAMYDGKQFVLNYDDITIVSINYRVNLWGQPNAPQLISSTQSQNFGLLDIEAAILWVHSNIAAFGGDPNRITLFGQSAGSVAIDAYAYAHPDDTIVKGIIMQSGTLDLALSEAVPPSARIGVQEANVTAWNQVADFAGCGTDATPEQYACMLGIGSGGFVSFSFLTGNAYYPIIDDITLFSDQPQRAAAGNFLHVPMLSGTTSDEGHIFTFVNQVLLHPIDPPPSLPDSDPISDLFTQVVFTCPARKAALDRAQAGVPTWRYEYQARLPLAPQNFSCHAADLPMIFGTYGSSIFDPENTQNKKILGEITALSSALMSAWVAFARDPVNGLANAPFSWPKYNSEGNHIVTFGNFSSPNGVTFVSEVPNDSVCDDLGLALDRFNAANINFPFVF